jgi:hypothetical protein
VTSLVAATRLQEGDEFIDSRSWTASLKTDSRCRVLDVRYVTALLSSVRSVGRRGLPNSVSESSELYPVMHLP